MEDFCFTTYQLKYAGRVQKGVFVLEPCFAQHIAVLPCTSIYHVDSNNIVPDFGGPTV